MSIVNVTNVVVLDNPTAFRNPLTFEVTFECLEALDAGKRVILNRQLFENRMKIYKRAGGWRERTAVRLGCL